MNLPPQKPQRRTVALRPRADASVEVWARVDRSGGPDACWLWNTPRGGRRYPTVKVHGRTVGANRFVLEMTLGRSLAPGEMALHSCDNKRCVNPRHLHAGTHAQNVAEAVERGRIASGDRHGSRTKPEAFKGSPSPLHGDELPFARLTSSAIIDIRSTPKTYGSGIALAQKYGVRPCTISDVRRGRTWRHLLAGSVA